MRLKILVAIFLTVLLGAAAFTALALKSRKNKPATQAKGPGQVQLEVVQLPTDAGIIPVVIQGERMSADPESGMLEAVFVVKNNTGKNIDAISVAVTSRVSRNSKESSSTHYLTRNSLIHPDIREIHHQSPLTPGQEWSFETEPLDPEAPALLRGITVQIDFLDFEDRTWLGPNKFGSNTVSKVRTGAAKYKTWLARKYAENGRSVNALLPLLERGEALPAEINLGDYERTGARHYQVHLLKAYKEHGTSEVEKYLNR